MAEAGRGPSIPGFRILGVAGRGGMGTVYRAEQDSPRRVVALKVLNRTQVDEASLAAFRREAELIAGLEHPGIVPLYTYGEHRGVPYLVFRFLPGGSAADELQRGPIGVAKAARWAERVAEALAFAHQRGFVHRDVKPSNILLDEGGNAYLTDFGIAGALEAEDEGGHELGSAPYISPEQVRGEPAGPRSDLYALAASLFELLVGEVAYPAETAVGMRVRHVHDPVPSARKRNPRVPPAFDDLLKWGLAKDPQDRPSSAAEFSLLLSQALLNPEQGLAGRPATETVLSSPLKRPWGGLPGWAVPAAVVAALGLGVIVIGGALGALVWLNRDGPSSTAQTTSPETAEQAVAGTSATATPEGLLLRDDFSDPGSGFATGGDQDGGVDYGEGRLRIRALREGVEWFSPSGRLGSQDVETQVSIAEMTGPELAHVGVLCRWRDSSNYSALALGLDNTFAMWQRQNGEIRWLTRWSPMPAGAGGIAPDSVMRAVCDGERLALWVGGEMVGEATDPRPVRGDVGLMAGLREPGEIVVEFDLIQVTQGIE